MFYAGYNRFGINLAFDSEYWTAYAFQTKKERDEWVKASEYNPFINSGYVACAITSKEMQKIVHCGKYRRIIINDDNSMSSVYI